MPRPRARCGTDSAYRRHLRLGERVDDACRRAHADTLRGGLGRARSEVREPARLVVPPPTRLEIVRRELSELQAELLTRLEAFAAAVRDDHFYDAADAEAEVSKLIDRWADLGDEINYREGYAFLAEDPELRDKLMAWGRETFDPEHDSRSGSEA